MKRKTKKEKMLLKNREYVYSIACVWLMLDQLIKLLVRSKIPLLEEIDVIPGFFSIYHVENKGGVLVLAFLHYYVLTEEKMTKWRIFGLGIVIGGIVGNLIDRILYGAVVDYLSFDIFGYGFPVFNIADIGITVGFVILAINILRRDGNEFRDTGDKRSREEN